MKWQGYAIKRVLLFVPILFGVSVVAFSIMQLVPGSPAVAMLGVKATPERVEQIEQQLGLNRPVIVQYLDWVTGVIQGNFGRSYSYNEPVASILFDRFFVSFEIVALTLVSSTLVSIPLGIVAAVNKNSAIDYLSMALGVTGVSIPTFFSGVLFIAVFGVYLGVLPTSGYVPPSEGIVENLQHMVLPVLTMTLVAVAVIMRMMRSSMIETLGENYIRFLRSKGLRQRSVVFGHALKNSFIPVVTVMGLQFGYMLSGTVVVEQIFAIPGLGRTVLQAVLQRDYPLVQGAVLLLALWFAVVNLLTDLVIGYLDPRIMEEAQ